MYVAKVDGDNVEILVNGDELYWFSQSLNECCNGFLVKNFDPTIGAARTAVVAMLAQIVTTYDGPIGQEG